MEKIWRILTRKKVIDHITANESELSRVLNTFDLTALGVGSTLGVGVYVLAGHVAKDTAGPSVVLSFLIAALASVFAGLCYAEFGARAPRAGSAYIYSYVCVGEFVAFVIGWNLILEYVIGSASVARGMTEYLDMLLNNTLKDTFRDIAPIDVPYLSKYFDFFSFGISVLLSIALAFGLKESSLVNNIFTIVNVFVVLFVIVAGSLKADTANWDVHANATTNTTTIGKGGFFPFGVEGMIKGAATCFYGFVGFDCIATTGEEVKNPQKAIPISIILSLFIVFLAYFGTSTVVTLMVPYYMQNANAPIPFAFEHIGWEWAKWIVSIGGIFGLCASLFGAMFPLPRIIYAMANDSLVFRFLGKVSPRFHTPVIGTLLEGFLTGLMAALFDLKQLVNMMSIGTLLAYTIVAACVLRLRYSDEQLRLYRPVQATSDSDDSDIYTDNAVDMPVDSVGINEDNELLSYESSSSSGVLGQIFNCGRHQNPTRISESIVAVEVLLYCLTCLLIGLCVLFWKNSIIEGDILAISLTSVCVFVAVVLVMSMVTQPTSKKELTFKVPLVPLIPAISILTNIYLMLMLDSHTWIRFAVWMALGLPTYYFSLRPYSEAQKDTHPIKAIISEKQTVNFYNNNGFVSDELGSTDNKPTKKQAPGPPRKTEDNIEVLKIEQELKKLDEMLEAVDNTIVNTPERKLSTDGISVVSDIAQSEESVVAVVHRDNVAPAEPNLPPSSLILVNTPASSSSSEPLQNGDVSNDKQEASSADSPLPPDTPPTSHDSGSGGSDEEKTDDSIVQISPAPPTPPPSLNNSPLTQTKKIMEPPPPPPSMPSLDTEDGSNKVSSTPRLTASNLNSILLRPSKRPENKETTAFEPDDDNLRVSSEQTKNFKEKLEGIYQRINVLPSYILYGAKKPRTEVITTDRAKNENVIEDSINWDEAKEKFVSFINSRDERKGRGDDENEMKSEETEIQVTPPADEIIDANKEEQDDFIRHKKRMGNVFRSIHLPEVSRKAIEDTTRNFKSLGQISDDKTKHRQAMNEIFKNIELRRKDSTF